MLSQKLRNILAAPARKRHRAQLTVEDLEGRMLLATIQGQSSGSFVAPPPQYSGPNGAYPVFIIQGGTIEVQDLDKAFSLGDFFFDNPPGLTGTHSVEYHLNVSLSGVTGATPIKLQFTLNDEIQSAPYPSGEGSTLTISSINGIKAEDYYDQGKPVESTHVYTAPDGKQYDLRFAGFLKTFSAPGPGGEASPVFLRLYESGGIYGVLLGRFKLRSDPPDLEIKSVDWNTKDGGIDFTYSVPQAYPAPITAAVYWAKGDTWADRLSDKPIHSVVVGQNGGSGSIHVDIDSLDSIKDLVKGGVLTDEFRNKLRLLVVADPPTLGHENGLIDEPNETNNFRALLASPDQTTKVPGSITIPGPLPRGVMKIEFRPAGGALKLEQAAAIWGVDHFNWINSLVAAPKYWTILRYRLSDYFSDPKKDVLQNPYREPSPLYISIDNPLFDPPLNAETFNYVYVYAELMARAYRNPGSADNMHYYYPEEDKFAENYKTHSTSRVLEFFDAARVPVSFYPENGYMGYSTQLVGVRPGRPDRLGPIVDWKTNATFIREDGPITGGGASLMEIYMGVVSDPATLPPVHSGGVFGITLGDQASPAVSIAPLGDLVVEQGAPVSLRVAVTNPGSASPLEFSLVEPPAGAVINPTTGVFSWTPTVGQEGAVPITVAIRRRESIGPDDLSVFHITVRKVAVPATPNPGEIPSPPSGETRDTTPPVVLSARRVMLTVRAKARSRPEKVTAIVVTFSEPVSPSGASAVGTYTVRAASQSRRKPPAYTKLVPLKSAIYDKATRTVTLSFSGKTGQRDPLQLLVRAVADLTDEAGNRLIGDFVVNLR